MHPQRNNGDLLALSVCFLALVVAVAWACLVSGCSEAPGSTTDARPAFTAMTWSSGKSMLPTFAEGELVRIEFCKFSELRGSDTVVYWHDGAKSYIHHRLAGRDGTGRWKTRGDNNPAADSGHMTADEFVGRTQKII